VAAITVLAALWVLAGGVRRLAGGGRRSPVWGGSDEKETTPTRFASFPFPFPRFDEEYRRPQARPVVFATDGQIFAMGKIMQIFGFCVGFYVVWNN
jgi:hypothetical protein